MGAIRSALAFVAYTSLLHSAVGQNRIDCTSCQNAVVGTDGSLSCHCDINIETLVERTGRADFRTRECHDELNLVMVWEGDVVQNGTVTNDNPVTLESVCTNDITLRMRDLYFSEEGAYFCPVINVCGIVSIGESANSPCITIQASSDTCHARRSCGECTQRAGCLWCDNACLPRVNNTDRCGVCRPEEAIFDSGSCPSDPPSPPSTSCGDYQNSSSCLLGGCMWSNDDSNCRNVVVAETSTPGPTGGTNSGGLFPKQPSTNSVQGGGMATPRDVEEGFKFNEYNEAGTASAGVVGTLMLLLCVASCCFCAIMGGKTIQNRKFIRLSETKIHVEPSDVASQTGSQVRVLPVSTTASQPEYFEDMPDSPARISQTNV